MKKGIFCLSVVLILILFATAWGGEIQRLILPSGVRVVLEEDHSRPVVAYQIWVGVGSADERPEEAGIAHLIEHMTFKGTDKFPQGVAAFVEGLGGEVNAYTTYDYTVYHVVMGSTFWKEAADALIDAVLHPRFLEEELQKEKEVVVEEIKMGEDDPSRTLHKLLWRRSFSVHPYGRPIIGSVESVRGFGREDLLNFHRKWYVPENMVFVGVGDFSSKDLIERLKVLFAEAEGGIPERQRGEEPPQMVLRTLLERGPWKERYLGMAFHVPALSSPDLYPLELLSALLTEGEASRLQRSLKGERGLVTSIYSYSFMSRDPGLFVIRATLPPGKVREGIKGICEELARIAEEGVGGEELRRAKTLLEADLTYEKETVQGRASSLGYFEALWGDARKEKEYLEGIRKVRPEEVREAARRYLSIKNLTLALLVPYEEEISTEELSDLVAPLTEVVKKAEVRKLSLENGATLLFLEDRTVPVVGIWVVFLGGLRYETPSKAGLSQLVAEMLTKGTESRTFHQLAEEVDRMGAYLKGFAGRNTFGVEAKGLSKDFPRLLRLVADVIINPSFPEEELQRAKERQLAALRRQRDHLLRRTLQLFRETLYGDHPYGLNPLGTEESIAGITRDDLLDYYQRFALPQNMVIAIVGDLNWPDVKALVRKDFEEFIGEGFSPPMVPRPHREIGIRRKEVPYGKGDQVHFVLGFLGTTLTDEDRYPLEVLEAALSGQGGRFFVKLRDEMGLAYAVDFFARCDLDPGYLGVYMATSPEKLERALVGVKAILEEVTLEGITEEELERAKRYLIGNHEVSLQGSLAMASTLALNERYGLGWDFFKRYPQRIKEVTLEDVLRVARRYIDMESYTLVILEPSGEESPTASQGASSPPPSSP